MKRCIVLDTDFASDVDDALALALACVYDESFCRFEDLEIEPADRARSVPHARAAGADAAEPADALRLRAHYVERLRSLEV